MAETKISEDLRIREQVFSLAIVSDMTGSVVVECDSELLPLIAALTAIAKERGLTEVQE